jgi:tRNA(Ile)-lysidine synthase
MLLAALEKRLQTELKLDRSVPLLLGFSGGPDSLALLHALRSLGYPLLAAHFDHGLRPESAPDALRAKKIAESYSIPFFTARADVAAYAEQHSMSIEEAARALRYPFLFRMAAEQGAQAVVVAHNADDQVETALMHLLRGAGAGGLRGMAPRLLPNPWSSEIPLLRPLLPVWRKEIVSYCQAKNLQPIEDPSNLDPSYFRNRLRHELLPTLEGYAPGFKRRLHNSADLLSADFALLETLAEQAWQRCLAQRGEGFLGFDRRAFLAEPLALQRQLLRRALVQLRPNQRDLDFNNVQRALDLINVQRFTAPQDWLAGLCLALEGQRVWIADWEVDLPVDWPQAPANTLHIETPAQVQLSEPWSIHMEATSIENVPKAMVDDGFQAWLDHDALGDELLLRRRQPGDRFQPLGLTEGSVKLSDFMINEKMPQRARAAWPLLCKGPEIIWLPGYRLAHPYRLQAQTKRALHLQLLRQGS